MYSITYKIVLRLVFVISLTFCSQAFAGFFPWDGNTLLKVNEVEYSPEEFRLWWGNWREKEMVVPESPDVYIDWLLFVKEAERMFLFDDNQFQRDVQVYLKVLSLVQLKNDEVDSKIIVNDKVLFDYYQKIFVPELTLNTIIYVDEESAKKAYQDLQSGKLMVNDLVKRVGERSKQAQSRSSHGKEVIDVAALKDMSASEDTLLGVQEGLTKRPYNMNPFWRDALKSLTTGSFSLPVPWQDSFVILNVIDVFEGDKADFESKKNQVRLKYRKNQEAILTNDLISRLKKKYNVVIDEEQIKKIDFESEEPSSSDKPIITIGERVVTEQFLIDKVKRDMALNMQYGFKVEGTERMAQRIVNGIVSQTLITMESLDRHYELQSPIRELIDFKKKNKLVIKINKQVVDQAGRVSDEELRSYYEENIADFTKPAVFYLAIISDTEEQLKKIWLEVVVNGKDIMAVSESRLGYVPRKQKYPENHLHPDVKKIAQKLAKGDLSQVFYANDKYNMVYMLDYIPKKITPFLEVKRQIRKTISNDKFDAARRTYLDELRTNAVIDINENAWNKLRNDLISEDK